jgi:hypothetical protein
VKSWHIRHADFLYPKTHEETMAQINEKYPQCVYIRKSINYRNGLRLFGCCAQLKNYRIDKLQNIILIDLDSLIEHLDKYGKKS